MGDGGVDVLAVGLLCRRQAQAESSYDISGEVHDRSRDAHDPLGDLLDFEGEAAQQLGTAVAVHAGHEHPADRPVW